MGHTGTGPQYCHMFIIQSRCHIKTELTFVLRHVRWIRGGLEERKLPATTGRSPAARLKIIVKNFKNIAMVTAVPGISPKTNQL